MSEETANFDMNDDDQEDLMEMTDEMSLLQEIRDDMYKMIPPCEPRLRAIVRLKRWTLGSKSWKQNVLRIPNGRWPQTFTNFEFG